MMKIVYSFEFNVGKVPSDLYAFSNKCYVSKKTYSNFKETQPGEVIFASIMGYAFQVESDSKIADDQIGLNNFHRAIMKLSYHEEKGK